MQSKHNEFNINSIKNYFTNMKNKGIKAIFAYFHNDSFKVLEGPPKLGQISKKFFNF